MRKVKVIAGLICGAMLAAAGTSAAPKPIPAHTIMHTTVLPLSEGPHLAESGATGYWTPQAAGLKRLEADLPHSVSSYYRQYLGIVQQGKRLIYINGFSTDVAPEFIGGAYDWHRHAVFVDDGGTGFFHATYDPKTRKFTGPIYNGVG